MGKQGGGGGGNQRANVFNPNNPAHGAAQVNRGNQLNPVHPAFHASRSQSPSTRAGTIGGAGAGAAQPEDPSQDSRNPTEGAGIYSLRCNSIDHSGMICRDGQPVVIENLVREEVHSFTVPHTTVGYGFLARGRKVQLILALQRQGERPVGSRERVRKQFPDVTLVDVDNVRGPFDAAPWYGEDPEDPGVRIVDFAETADGKLVIE